MPAIVDTGAQFSCIRVDVIEYLHLTGHPSSVFLCDLNCLLADCTKGHVTNAVKLHFGLLSFSWTHEFKILQNGPFPAILGLDFLQHSQMTRIYLQNPTDLVLLQRLWVPLTLILTAIRKTRF